MANWGGTTWDWVKRQPPIVSNMFVVAMGSAVVHFAYFDYEQY